MDGTYSWKSNTFDHGYLLKNFSFGAIKSEGVKPTIDELALFGKHVDDIGSVTKRQEDTR